MSNLYNTIRSPVRTTTMTNKSKSHIVTNDLVERKTRALEGSLNKAKLNMQQQYQTKSTSTNPPRRNVDNKETKQNIREKQTDLFPTKPKKLIKCGQCDKDEAKVKCLECVENYCANCYAEFHVRGALQRHHRILLSPFKKRNPSLSSDILLNNDSSEQQSNSIYPEKTTSLFSFQQSFLQWRDNNTNKGQRKPEGGPTATDKVDYSKKLPYIERTNLTKKQTHTQKNSGHELKRTSIPKIGPLIDRSYSLTDTIHGNQPITDIEPTHEDLSTSNIEIITNNENPSERERSATHISTKSSSRPSSVIIRTDSFRSRPNSSTQIQQSLLPVSTDDLEGNTESQLILSRPTSTRSEKFDPPLNPLDYVENIPPTQLHLPLENIFEESKMDLDYQITDSTENLPRLITPNDELSTYAFCMNSTVITPTPGRNSPFSFSNSLSRLNRLDSASSRDTTVCGFFTEVVHRKKMLSPTTPPPPLPILESSTLNESRFTLESDLHPVEIEKSSRKSSAHEVSKESIVVEEKQQQQSKVKIENDSRPGSSSLPFSRPSSRKSSLSQKPIIETSPSSSQPEIVDSTKTENKLETSSSHINDESINLLKNKDESENTNTLPTKKKIRRRRQRPIMTYDDPSGYRKLEFSIGDGLKWQEASMESMSSTIHSEPSSTGTTPRMMSPSNPVNNKLSEQFSKYDHDDGRSSRTYQNLIDEECFNQLRQELCSELNLEGSDEDSILNDQIIKMIQDSRNRFNEKDWLKINTKLRDNDSTQQSTLDNNNFLIHE